MAGQAEETLRSVEPVIQISRRPSPWSSVRTVSEAVAVRP